MSNSKKEQYEKRLVEIYMDGVWDYLMEHSDLTRGGSWFVKFHTDGKQTFNRRILARIKGYHRSDPVEKNRIGEELQAKMKSQKEIKAAARELRKQKTIRNRIRSLLIKLVNLL